VIELFLNGTAAAYTCYAHCQEKLQKK